MRVSGIVPRRVVAAERVRWELRLARRERINASLRGG